MGRNGVHNEIASHFDEIATLYDEATEWRRAPSILNWYRRKLDGVGSCIDVGAGTGLVSQGLASTGVRIIRLDLSLRMLRQSRFGYPIRGSAEDIPLKRGSVDAAAIRQVLHYTRDSSVLAEVTRVTRRGGPIVIGQIVGLDRLHAEWWSELKRLTQPLRRTFYSIQDILSLVQDASLRLQDQLVVPIRRRSPWRQFLIEAKSEETQERIRNHVATAPPEVSAALRLEVSEDEVRYYQYWLLIACRSSS